jgi:hypothetical protein
MVAAHDARRGSGSPAIATSGQPIHGVDKLDGVNPRYRRLVIPSALVVLLVIVVIAALVRG